MLNCAICGNKLFTENPKRFFCPDCYKHWESDIVAKAKWIRVCVNNEKKQRRQALKDRELIHLDDKYDVGDFNGEYRLTLRIESLY